jgi:pimeloyl-ACP methyl ester carboxylesterase
MLIVQYLQPRPWAKPLYPTTWRRFRQWIANAQTEEFAREVFADLVCESGRVHCEIGFPRLDRAKAATVNFAAITSPVLAIAGGCDRLVPARIARQTAGRYQKGTYVEIPRADHFVFGGEALPITMGHIDNWIAQNHCAPPPNVDRLVAGAPRYNINSHLLNTHHYSCC